MKCNLVSFSMKLMIDFKRVLDLYDPESSVFIFSEYQIQMNNLFFSNVCRDKCELPPWCEPRVAALGGSLDRSRAWGGLTDVSFQVVGGENKMHSFLFLIMYLAESLFAGSSSPCVWRNLGPSFWPSKNQVQHRWELYWTVCNHDKRKFDTILLIDMLI